MPDRTVLASGLNLRASLTTGGVNKVLRRSSRLEILGEEIWYRVRTRDGLEGYVFGDYVEKDMGVAQPDPGAPAGLSPRCQLRQYEHERFVGRAVTADRDFFRCLDRIAGFAKNSGLFVYITSSTRDPGVEVRGAVVTPAKRSNHLVGHAVDFNLRAEDGSFFTSRELKRLDEQPDTVVGFIQLIRDDPELRWGGDFTRKDVVHIDDSLNLRDPGIWDAKLASRA